MPSRFITRVKVQLEARSFWVPKVLDSTPSDPTEISGSNKRSWCNGNPSACHVEDARSIRAGRTCGLEQ